MVTVTLAQVVVLQVPLYLTKYVVLILGDTIMLLPVPADVPPQELVNHSATAPVPALPPTSVRVVLLPLQTVDVPEMLVGAVERVFTVINWEAQAVILQVPS